MAADFDSARLQFPQLLPGQREKTTASGVDIMLEFSLSCNVVGTDEQHDGDPGFFDDGSQIDKVVAIAVIECEDHGRRRDTVILQHFYRLVQRHDPVMLL